MTRKPTKTMQRRALNLIDAAEIVICLSSQNPSHRGKVVVGILIDPKKLNFIGTLAAMDAVLDSARLALTAGERHD